MSKSVLVPGDRGDSAAARSAAELITAVRLPDVESFPSNFPGFAELPAFAPFEDPSDLSAEPRLTKVDVARSVMDDCAAALAGIQILEARVAGCKAALVERFVSAARAEEQALCLDRWQSTVSEMSARAEIAAALTITEGSVGALIEHSLTVVRDLPGTWDQVRQGCLPWGHAVVIAEETITLGAAGIPADAIEAYERALLGKAPGCTLPSFKGKARRLLEKSHPESIATRTKAAYERRRVEIQRVHDGMSWLNLHLPAPTVEGIWDQCTFIARNAQGPGESRTLTQLRADVEAALLLGQSLAVNGINDNRPLPALTDATVPEASATTGAEVAIVVPPAGAFGFPGFDPTGVVHPPAVPEDYARLCAMTGAGPEPDPCDPGSLPGRFYTLDDRQIPAFPTPNYNEPRYAPPDLWNPESVGGAGPSSTGSWTSGSGDGAARSAVPWLGMPPMPQVMPVLLIPALSLVGASCDPAILEGYGPISIEVAKRLLADASCFYRAFTDPMTGEALALNPETRRVDRKMRIMLRAANEFCTFPGCSAKAAHSEVDHIKPWSAGGTSVLENLEPLDKRHHLVKHFKDDRTRQGRIREDQSAERAALKLRGWTPTMTESGRPGWTSPTGRYYPPQPAETAPPSYPKWIAKTIAGRLEPAGLAESSGPGAQASPAGSGNLRPRTGPIDVSPAEALMIHYLAG
ncbi:HNH endonuclease signature motif containing protein [Arthrobacter sp. ERGS1:01]|uniref:HNH endonuclease signature motif containing protein n=1 Tax=Arthrobacter sp. ERGS1:01 TaxID=1704044 RepID=UPI0006B5786F|nr:HNH endonuclease signature motif containing protein [Arthrobacter sp. ERGS1:01]